MSEIEEIAKQVLALDEQRESSNVCFAVCRTAAPQLAKAVIEQERLLMRALNVLESSSDATFRREVAADIRIELDALRKAGGL